MKIIKCILLAGCFTGSTVAAAADALSFRLNWYIVGLHAPFLYGKELGFYKDEGIDLTINEGRGSISTLGVRPKPNQMMNSGAIAIFGMICRNTTTG